MSQDLGVPPPPKEGNLDDGSNVSFPPSLHSHRVRARRAGFACGGPLAKISILAAHAQHSALLGLEPLFTTNISRPLLLSKTYRSLLRFTLIGHC